MEVFLEKIPQDGQIGPMQVIHWAIRVGSGPGSRCYEFESEGVQIGEHTSCDHGYKIKRQRLGVTRRTHPEIERWVLDFGRRTKYNVAGRDLGQGANCQDFAVELCAFLGVDAAQLPWRQARQVEAVVGGAVAAASVLAVLGGALARFWCRDTRRDDAMEFTVDAQPAAPARPESPARPGGKEDDSETDAVKKLAGLGVPEARARAAWRESGGDLDRAAELALAAAAA